MSKILKPYPRHRTLMALTISLLPSNGLRVLLYRLLMGYRIGPGSRIGVMTVIACESFHAGRGVSIGRSNRFIGPVRVELGDKVIIGRFNQVICGASAADPAKAAMNYARRFVLGDKVLVNDSHYFDAYGLIEIGAGSWVAGTASQFWTHGASVMERDIVVGAGCYLGSAVRFAPGSGLGDGCVLGLGSVVVSKIDDRNAVIAGFPAKKIREISVEDDRQFVFQAN